ncbi:MAG: RidA family protein [Gammaproteobacteria bacterium]|nr:MAG: RidA family protein [Gammaproteobacteria bacterium]
METKLSLQDNIQRLRPTPRWSDATIFNGIAHFVEVPADTEQDMTSQIVQIFKQAEATLAEIGTNKSHLLSATVYLTHVGNVAIFNQLWEAWLPKNCAPSRACIKVELLDPKMLIEIAFVAAIENI